MNFIKKTIYKILWGSVSLLNKSYDLIYHYSFVVFYLLNKNKISRMFKLLVNFFFKFKKFNSSKDLIPMDKILFYKKSRNDKGDINLLVFIDFKFISLKFKWF